MKRTHVSLPFLALAFVCTSSFATCALAQLNGPPITIEAANASGSGLITFDWSAAVWNGSTQTWTWSQSQSSLIRNDANATLATLTSASISVRLDQSYSTTVNFGLIAGTSDTTFKVTSCVASVAPVPAAIATGRATASFTVSDQNWNGANMIGADGGASGAYVAYLNGLPPTGTQFTNLVGVIFVGPGGTATGSQSDPPVGYRALGADLHCMAAEMRFTLSAGDRAYATTGFTLPEPPPCPGDFNHDYISDLSDLLLILNSFGSCNGDAGYAAIMDADADNCIGLSDVAMYLTLYGTSCQ